MTDLDTPDLPEDKCPLCGGPLASDRVCADDTCGDNEEDD